MFTIIGIECHVTEYIRALVTKMFLEIFYIVDAISNLDPIRVLWDRPNTHLKSSLERLLQTCNHVHCGETYSMFVWIACIYT